MIQGFSFQKGKRFRDVSAFQGVAAHVGLEISVHSECTVEIFLPGSVGGLAFLLERSEFDLSGRNGKFQRFGEGIDKFRSLLLSCLCRLGRDCARFGRFRNKD